MIKKILIFVFIAFAMILNFSPGTKAADSGEIINDVDVSYTGSKIIYKRDKAILLKSDIYNFTFKNWVITDENVEYDVYSYYVTLTDDNYSGNGNSLGRHNITSTIVVTFKNEADDYITMPFSEVIQICVVDDIEANYIYDNHYYYDIDYLPNGESFMYDLQLNNQLPFEQVYLTYYGDFFNEFHEPVEGITTGEYLVKFEYASSSGSSGIGTSYIHVLNPVYNTHDDNTDSSYLIFGILFIFIIIFIIILMSKKKKKGYKFK